jgi:hypothetical protein
LNLAVLLLLPHSLVSVRCYFLAAVLVVSLVFPTSCSDTDRHDVASKASDTPVTVTQVLGSDTSAVIEKIATEVPVPLTVLERSDISGQLFDPASLAGREVLLWFWAPW